MRPAAARWLVNVVGTAVVAVGAVVTPEVAAASHTFSCNNETHNGVGADGVGLGTYSGINGVGGDVYIPFMTTADLHDQFTSAADIAMIIQDSVTHFYQFGWYVGVADGLPTASAPRLFVGEGVVSPVAAEVLTALNFSPTQGSLVRLRLKQVTDSSSPHFRKYQAFYGTTLVWTSTTTTTVAGLSRFLGETNFDCADMFARANSSTSGPTLEHHKTATGWRTWSEHWNTDFGTPDTSPDCWFNGRVNNYTATVFAYDLC